MKEVITTGKSLESIREQYAAEWSCLPEQLRLEVIDKPGIIQRSWKVKVILDTGSGEDRMREDSEESQENTAISWDGVKYTILPGRQVETIIPFSSAGKLKQDEKEILKEFKVEKGVSYDFYPERKQGGLTWNIEVSADGSKAVAKVKHEHSGRYVLAQEIPPQTKLYLERFVTWESETVEVTTEEELQRDLAQRGIIHGIRPNLWVEFLTVDGRDEVLVAEYTPPVPSIQPEIIDYVGEPMLNEEDEEEKIDFFACKLRVCQKDELLARKIPGQEGKPGMDILGNILPVEKVKDFEFKLKKNVYLSVNGLEVLAACAGTPIRVNNYTYLVENAYILNQDIDLTTGSIDFPGDVNIGRNVKDGFYVYSGGRIQIQESVSGASLKAEAGLTVINNIIASKIMVGEKHVFRSRFFMGLKDIKEELSVCIAQVEQLQNVSGNTNVGQLLKIILEKNFQQLPKKIQDLEALLSIKDPDYISQELEIAVRSLKHFLVGLGPLQLKNLQHLKNALKVADYFLTTKGDLIPVSVVCDTNYVQNSEINCAGDFLCKKGIYNSTVKAEGDVKIQGVCRGGEINCNGSIYIWELGGSCMSATTLRAEKNSRITVEYCHPNIKIFVGKELVRIDEAVQKLVIYREKAILQVEKLRWGG